MRCADPDLRGDVDAGVLAFLERTEKLTATQSEEMLNKKSGLLGLSGVSSDMREILKAAAEYRIEAVVSNGVADHRLGIRQGAIQWVSLGAPPQERNHCSARPSTTFATKSALNGRVEVSSSMSAWRGEADLA